MMSSDHLRKLKALAVFEATYIQKIRGSTIFPYKLILNGYSRLQITS